MQERFLAQVSTCVKELLHCGQIGAIHGPRLGAQVGGAAGTVFPIIGNVFGAIVGGILGFPLGFLMGVIAGAINRRWGWTIGGALPGFVLAIFMRQNQINTTGYITEMGFWYIFCLGIIPFAGGALAGSRLGRLLERSPDITYRLHRTITQENLARIPVGIRLGLLGISFLTVADLCLSICRATGNL